MFDDSASITLNVDLVLISEYNVEYQQQQLSVAVLDFYNVEFPFCTSKLTPRSWYNIFQVQTILTNSTDVNVQL